MKKRVSSILLVLALLLCMLPAGIHSAQAASETEIPYAVEGGNIYFDPTTGTITSADFEITAAVIPAQIEGVDVVAIGEYAFDGISSLTSLTLPDSVSTIEDFAFRGTGFTEITVPGTVKTLGKNVFSFCKNLKMQKESALKD